MDLDPICSKRYSFIAIHSKISNLDKINKTTHVVMTQIIDRLQFETRPYPLINFRVAKSTLFLC